MAPPGLLQITLLLQDLALIRPFLPVYKTRQMLVRHLIRPPVLFRFTPLLQEPL